MSPHSTGRGAAPAALPLPDLCADGGAVVGPARRLHQRPRGRIRTHPPIPLRRAAPQDAYGQLGQVANHSCVIKYPS